MIIETIKEKLKGTNNHNVEKKEKFRERLEDYEISKKIEDMHKSANERELERLYKENREKQIKTDLDRMNKIRNNEIEFGHNPINTPNMFAPKRNDYKLLKDKNIFNGKSNYLSKNNTLKNNKNLFSNGRLHLCH